MTVQNLQTRIINLKREINALKTASQVAPKIRGYFTEFAPTSFSISSDEPGWRAKITYADGDNDILTFLVCSGGVWAMTPQGNTQEVHFFSQDIATLWVFSTRPILKIESVS